MAGHLEVIESKGKGASHDREHGPMVNLVKAHKAKRSPKLFGKAACDIADDPMQRTAVGKVIWCVIRYFLSGKSRTACPHQLEVDQIHQADRSTKRSKNRPTAQLEADVSRWHGILPRQKVDQ
jgi:hypothetical protein